MHSTAIHAIWGQAVKMLPVLALMLVAKPIAAQIGYADDTQDTATAYPQLKSLPDRRPGETARSAAGQAGQRLTREEIAEDAGIKPMGRITSRVQNRAQTRIRNRIDRYYDPQANTTSPFVVAGEQARTAGRQRR